VSFKRDNKKRRLIGTINLFRSTQEKHEKTREHFLKSSATKTGSF